MKRKFKFLPVIIVALLFSCILLFTDLLGVGGIGAKVLSNNTFSKKDNLIKKDKDFKIPENPAASEQNLESTSSHPSSTQDTNVQRDKRLVVIDAGHGGSDTGSKQYGLVEKDITLDIALRLYDILKKSGVDTYMIRNTDVFIDHKERILLANNMNASLFLSIHCDWYTNASLHGTQTLYYPSKSLAIGNLVEIDYASIIQQELANALETYDRGIDDRPDLAVLRHAKMPSVLVELAFLSNKSDAQLLATEDFRQKAAEALYHGIRKSLAKID